MKKINKATWLLAALIGILIGLWSFLSSEKGQGPLLPAEQKPQSSLNQAVLDPYSSNSPDSTATDISPLQKATPSQELVSPQNEPHAELTPEDVEKRKVLSEILNSRNDNDLRMDTELKILSESLKGEIKKMYSQLAAESRNERGTLVFLIGRNLKTKADFDFLSEVLRESECLSLADCSQAAAESDPHHEGTTASTLAYPQIVTLTSLEKLLSQPSVDPEMKNKALNLLQEARGSRTHIAAQMAQQLFERFSK